MTLKKQFEEYIKTRQPGHKSAWEYMSLEKFCRRHFHTFRPMFARHGIGATKVGIRNLIRMTSIIRDLGRMGIISNVDEAIEAVEGKYRDRYEFKH